VRSYKQDCDTNQVLQLSTYPPGAIDQRYNDFPQRTLHGFLKILTIVTSEAIAESHGSLIDALHLRYKNTDSDDRRVQKELQIRLMAPSPCSAEGEKLVQQVATRMARNHSFLKTTHGGMGRL